MATPTYDLPWERAIARPGIRPRVIHHGARVLPMEAYRAMNPSDRINFEALAVTLENLGFSVTVKRSAPKWQIGDVVVVLFPRNPKPYTYVHDGRHFPGVNVDVSDETMTAYWRAGSATILAREGKHYQDLPIGERS